jgi:hypothetical protein
MTASTIPPTEPAALTCFGNARLEEQLRPWAAGSLSPKAQSDRQSPKGQRLQPEPQQARRATSPAGALKGAGRPKAYLEPSRRLEPTGARSSCQTRGDPPSSPRSLAAHTLPVLTMNALSEPAGPAPQGEPEGPEPLSPQGLCKVTFMSPASAPDGLSYPCSRNGSIDTARLGPSGKGPFSLPTLSASPRLPCNSC